MGKPTGFLEFNRETPLPKSLEERIKDYREFYLKFEEEKLNQQAARCMDCGIPFCHHGCPLGNNIPDFNDKVYAGDWLGAYEILTSTNNFPEFTGRICPAPCEVSCVLALDEAPTAIELIEKSIVEKAFQLGLVKPNLPKFRTGKRVAVIGSGPAGLAAAAQLNKAGHWVIVFERADQLGGLLRYGIPDFKIEKHIIDRRVNLMKEEGIAFKTNAYIGVDISAQQIVNDFDAVVLCCGSTIPRDLPIGGRDLKGVHFAMDFLTHQNRINAGLESENAQLSAKDKNVVVIGGGDTGADCVGTSNRHGAKTITQIELLEKPPLRRAPSNPWPQWSNIVRTSSSHVEGCERMWSVVTKEFIGDANGNLTGIKIAEIKWVRKTGEPDTFVEVHGTERVIPCEMALLAIGFMYPQKTGLLHEVGVELDKRGNVKAPKYQTNISNVFTAGDMHRGQSLVVWAISEGREAAREVDKYLMNYSYLESKDSSLLDVV